MNPNTKRSKDLPQRAAPAPAASEGPDPRLTAVDLEAGPAFGGAGTSPARALQDALTVEFAENQPDRRWSKRATLAFVVATCGAFWAAVGLGLSILAR